MRWDGSEQFGKRQFYASCFRTNSLREFVENTCNLPSSISDFEFSMTSRKESGYPAPESTISTSGSLLSEICLNACLSLSMNPVFISDSLIRIVACICKNKNIRGKAKPFMKKHLSSLLIICAETVGLLCKEKSLKSKVRNCQYLNFVATTTPTFAFSL